MLLLAWVLSALADDAATSVALEAHRARVELAVLSLRYEPEHLGRQAQQARVRSLEEQQERLGEPDEAEVRAALQLDLAHQEVEILVLLTRYQERHPEMIRARTRAEALRVEPAAL